MAVKSLFPDDMMKSSSESLTLEVIAGKLTHFHLQAHLLHWQTTSYAQHKALEELYEYIEEFKDGLVEKLMGYTGKRPSGCKIETIDGISPQQLVDNILMFSSKLKMYAEQNNYLDVSNLADELSGQAAKIKYLLSLS
jgi:DNA-binding ferritin-like protein